MISTKIFVVLLLLVIINVLLYVFLMSNKKHVNPPQTKTIPDSDLGTDYEFNMYYIQSCSWSQKALPDFAKLKKWVHEHNNKIGNKTIHVHMIDVNNLQSYSKKHKKKIQKDIKQIGIDGYPTIVLFNGGTKTIDTYDDDRTLEKYKNFLKNLK